MAKLLVTGQIRLILSGIISLLNNQEYNQIFTKADKHETLSGDISISLTYYN